MGFGCVKAFHLVKADTTAVTSKGYGFVEYTDPDVTHVAVIGLNGMDMGGGKVLSARIAAHRSEEGLDDKEEIEGSLSVPGVGNIAPIVPSTITGGIPPIMRYVDGVDVEGLIDAAMGLSPMPTIDLMAGYRGLVSNSSMGVISSHLSQKVDDYSSKNYNSAPAVSMSVSTVNEVVVPDKKIGFSIPGEFNVAKASLNTACINNGDEVTISLTKTRILVLLNMVTDQDLATDDEYEILIDEVRGECEKFGSLVSMRIPRFKDGHTETAVKKIFLEYATVCDAMNAERELVGRQFANSTIQVAYFSELDYINGELS